MSVLAQVLDDLAARGETPHALGRASAVPYQSTSQHASERRKLPSRRQFAVLVMLAVLLSATGVLAWNEHRAKSAAAVDLGRDRQELNQSATTMNVAVNAVSNASPADAQPVPAPVVIPSLPSASEPVSARETAIIMAPVHVLPVAARPSAVVHGGEHGGEPPVPPTAVTADPVPVKRSAASLADPQADLARAADLIARGRGREAKPLLLDLLERDPRNAAARGALVALQSEAGERTQALVTLLDGVSVDAARFVAPAAQLQTELGDARGALYTLQRMPLERRDGAFHALAGGIALAAEAPQQAVEAYQRAVSSPAARPLWLVGLALAHESAGQSTEAQAAYVRALQQPQLPSDAKAFVQQKLGAQPVTASSPSIPRTDARSGIAVHGAADAPN